MPWWALVSSAGAPVLLIGGWSLGARLRPGFDPVVQTISDLARSGTAYRWVMSVALVAVGVCHVTTALGLRPAAAGGRLLLAAGGLASVLVAASPLPVGDGGSRAHTLAAAAAFTALSLWPAAAARRSRRSQGRVPAPWGVRPATCLAAAAVLCCLLGWFGTELVGAGRHLGLAERVAAGAQALWPLAVAATSRRAQPGP